MTTPIATASNAMYTVEFDGATVTVLTRRGRKARASMPLHELRAVEFTPARAVVGGAVRFRTSRPSRYDRIVFNSSQQPEMERLVQAIGRFHRVPPPAPDPGPPADPWQASAPPLGPGVIPSGEGLLIRRLLALTLWTEGIYLALLLVPILGVVAFAVWFWLMR